MKLEQGPFGVSIVFAIIGGGEAGGAARELDRTGLFVSVAVLICFIAANLQCCGMDIGGVVIAV